MDSWHLETYRPVKLGEAFNNCTFTANSLWALIPDAQQAVRLRPRGKAVGAWRLGGNCSFRDSQMTTWALAPALPAKTPASFTSCGSAKHSSEHLFRLLSLSLFAFRFCVRLREPILFLTE